MDWFLNNLKNNINFSFARFNDGEVGGIMNPNFTASRGAQFINETLSQKLKEGLKFQKNNYWIGIPCPICYPEMNKVANDLVGDYPYKTLAVDLINKNYQRFLQEGVPLLIQKPIYWIGSEDQDLSQLVNVGFNIKQQYKLPTKNAFSEYNTVKNLYTKFKDDCVVILSLGPLERVLAKEWFEKKDTLTYLGLGSMFDPWTRGIQHGYHKQTLKPCRVCN
ncbi:GT-D fold domain-containing glycosyltransferase [bacterium]|jgi:hypothetical protein|nr:GT-D fold domain-containing glycosyltransferase [bacterium]